MRTFNIWTIGCQYNVHDGIVLTHILKQLGFNEKPIKEADFIIILACSVRQTAIDRVFGRIKHWGNKKIILTGCVLPQDRKKFAKLGIEFWDIRDTPKLSKILGIKEKKKIEQFKNEGAKFSNYVPIMVGCNNFCSYCAVPFTRGREFSIPFNTVVNSVKSLIGKKAPTPSRRSSNRSVGEIMLLGQNVNSYKYGFAKLLEKLNALPGNFKISFISNHPKDMTDDIIHAVATLPKIKKEIHLPLQSGSDRILKLMNRPYKVKTYLEIIDRIRKANPKIKISTDAIVGFPTETEKDFKKTVDIFKKVKFSQAYIGKYSPRPGTAAAKMKDNVSWNEKQLRWHILNKLVNIDK